MVLENCIVSLALIKIIDNLRKFLLMVIMFVAFMSIWQKHSMSWIMKY